MTALQRCARIRTVSSRRCAARQATTVEIDAAGRFEPFPLTDVQMAYVLGRGEAHAYGGVGCHGYGELRFDEIDAEAMERAWATLVERHDMLRAIVDGGGSQRVLSELPPYRIEVTDVRDAADDVVAEAIESTRVELDHLVYSTTEWPLFTLRITRAPDFAILHVSIDFLVADFVSIQLLLRELDIAYVGLDLGPAPGVTYRDLLLAERRRRDRDRDRDRHYWSERIADLPAQPQLPRAATEESGHFRRHQIELGSDSWARLRTAAGAASVSPSCAILAAYAEVVGRWSADPAFTLTVTVLNRPALHPEVNRVVGDFTSVELLAVDGRNTSSFAERARAIQARLWEDLDHGAYTGIEIARDLRRARGDGAALFPVVFTSSIGLRDGDQDGASPMGLSRLVYGISQTPQVWIDCQAMETASGITINWDVREGILADGVVDVMFTSFADFVSRLADGDEAWSASDPVAVPAAEVAHRPTVPDRPMQPATSLLLHAEVLRIAAATPGRVAVVGGAGQLTYGALVAPRCGSRATARRRRLPSWVDYRHRDGKGRGPNRVGARRAHARVGVSPRRRHAAACPSRADFDRRCRVLCAHAVVALAGRRWPDHDRGRRDCCGPWADRSCHRWVGVRDLYVRVDRSAKGRDDRTRRRTQHRRRRQP